MRSHSVPIAMAQTLSTVGDILDRGGERMNREELSTLISGSIVGVGATVADCQKLVDAALRDRGRPNFPGRSRHRSHRSAAKNGVAPTHHHQTIADHATSPIPDQRMAAPPGYGR